MSYKSVCKPPVHCPKKGGDSYQSKITEPIYRISAFQNGRHSHVKKPFKTRGFSHKNRSKGCLPICPNLASPPKISTVRVEKRDVEFSMSSLRTGKSPPDLHKNIIKASCGSLRKMGIRLIIYLDDILIMDESKALAQKHTAVVASLLTSLGFVISNEKSMFAPTQEIQFWGFRVDSMLMSLSLSGEKISSIKKECQHLLNIPQ